MLLADLMVVQWMRWRDRVSLDICLVFGSLAILLILERPLRLTQIQAPWMRPLGISVLLAHPYLLLRVVSHFRPVSRAFCSARPSHRRRDFAARYLDFRAGRSDRRCSCCSRVSLFRLAAGLRRMGLSPGREGRRRCDALADAARGARRDAAGDRLSACDAHQCGLPVLRDVTAALIPLAALGAAVNYYFAFAPPSWLRRLWQSSELYGFLAERALTGGLPSQSDLLNRLCSFAVPAVGAHRRLGGVVG